MAQVKMQTTANLSGPAMSPMVLPLPVTTTNTLGLPSSMNGSISESAASCSSPTAGLVDPAPSSNSPAPLQDNMANPKEKTPMCLVNELARFNRIQPQYKLLNERGPAHAKMFTVQLTLGEQTWEAEGSSIKKAQHAAASKALNETTLPKPTPRPPKNNVNNNPGSITPTVELNGLAMKRGEPAIYRPLDPKPIPNYRANYNFRGMYNQRYHCPVPKIFYVQLTVGNSEFFGEGKTRQAARHNAAMKALQALQNEPIPEKLPQNGETGKESEEDKDANKSEISVVFEIALKRNIPVSFEVIKESGPPHMKSFVTRVTVGEFTAEGEGNSKKLSKKRAAMSVLQELKKLPPLPVIERPKLYFKKRPKTILKTGPEYGQGMNPISRLAQIQQAKKEKEPEYVLLSERGMPRRREFVMQVKVGNEITTGTGPNKKIAKRNAAEAMLLQLGYKASTPLQDQPEKLGENKSWNGQNVGFPEPTSNTPKGILHLSPDVYQEMEASRNKSAPGTTVSYLSSKEMSQTSSSFFSISPTTNSTATIARELLMNGTSPTAEAIGLKGISPASPCSAVQPSKQLEYLARIQGFQVHYSDRQNGKECMTCLTLSPVQMTFQGIGSSIEASHDQAALSALKQFSEQGLDPVEGAMKVENGSHEKQVKHLGEKADNKQTNSGTIAQDCKDSKAVV
ncbi:double-stranded RNA-binding protein Staufen homolog 2 isoform X1 [Tyto alba]|uniref:double-stranded RNA-binding protein Staufen homolog 2 isoform X1 n=1 Tax=Tyto alba TaxID=56313 RepID=UPI0014033A10|nr:double-stranded RNA-binding protein Staufen homolog 2 isoform X1 [Tyto alba]XP_032863845.1 double-stranded RNA-binding protein Staufen homolog 2 isoform X1 [Tyto alba]XP_032863846.1 double-stranded RNA-binding protein Staufen homolog 2 isoform X1 [Tyto alba]XP_032863847.1 double-stranded RNA-binding protein Staufen homolog 2 isoform X1 [Tyto alba]XP_042642185.1 double-stranded RNA-binding protein Staufen homolog 2 isoform X1 [Tyto alba]XP_042642186.1 double-stranded RNA-binding protein Stau